MLREEGATGVAVAEEGPPSVSCPAALASRHAIKNCNNYKTLMLLNFTARRAGVCGKHQSGPPRRRVCHVPVQSGELQRSWDHARRAHESDLDPHTMCKHDLQAQSSKQCTAHEMRMLLCSFALHHFVGQLYLTHGMCNLGFNAAECALIIRHDCAGGVPAAARGGGDSHP